MKEEEIKKVIDEANALILAKGFTTLLVKESEYENTITILMRTTGGKNAYAPTTSMVNILSGRPNVSHWVNGNSEKYDKKAFKGVTQNAVKWVIDFANAHQDVDFDLVLVPKVDLKEMPKIDTLTNTLVFNICKHIKDYLKAQYGTFSYTDTVKYEAIEKVYSTKSYVHLLTDCGEYNDWVARLTPKAVETLNSRLNAALKCLQWEGNGSVYQVKEQ